MRLRCSRIEQQRLCGTSASEYHAQDLLIMYPFPNPPFFSCSSAPTFLARPHSPPRLGKHSLRQCHSPDRPEVSAQKRARFLSSGRGNVNVPQDEPWHRNDRFVRKFNFQELQSIVEPEKNVNIVPDVVPIHPILRPLLGLTDEVPGITYALQLATRFLTSRHTLPFFYTLLTTQLEPLFAESQHYGAALAHIQRPKFTGLQDTERNITLQIMVALAPHISIQISPDPRLATRWAYTERVTPPIYIDAPAYKDLPKPWPIPAESLNPLLRQLNFSGTNAVVNLSPSFLRTLHPDNPLPRNPQRLRAAYMLGITLIHEVAHAVYMCRFPTQAFPDVPPSFRTDEYEPFFAGQRKAELGHALETCLFGGGKILSLGQADDFAIGLGWQRWPDGEEFYVRNKKGGIEALSRCGSKPAKWQTVYAVRHDWARRQFEAKFWERLEVEGLGGGLLKVSKELGARVRNGDFLGEGNGLQSSASSADRGADGEGVVRPGQPFVESSEDDFSDDGSEDE